MRLIPRLQARFDALRSERGFSMIIVVGVMAASSLFVAAAFSAANGDLPLTRDSQDRKQAYAAAEAGINFYQYHLNQDPDYWTKCTTVPAPNGTELQPVNQAWNGAGADPRRWRKVPGSGDRVHDRAAAGERQRAVHRRQPDDDDPGLDRRRSASARPAARAPASKLRRTLVATFRRKSFLDFLYFTDFETVDPLAYYRPADQARAASECADKYRSRRAPRGATRSSSPTPTRSTGPFHTNDDILTCGTPIFGRDSQADPIEFTGQPPGLDASAAAAAAATRSSTGPVRAERQEAHDAADQRHDPAPTRQTGYLFTGTTKIRFNGRRAT